MNNTEETLSTILMILFLVAILIIGAYFWFLDFNGKRNKKKTVRNTQTECKKALNETKRRNFFDFFWSDSTRFYWITILLLFVIALGLAIETFITIFISVFLSILTIFFFIFAWRSYNQFDALAKARLADWESAINSAIKKEISFDGDNIQSFTADDDEFDTSPEIFTFPIPAPPKVLKVSFPLFGKPLTIILERKLEFLILSREYFSICKGAAPFNLLNPAHGDIKKKCAEKPPSGGECDEYYYSQMRNVKYDAAAKGIRIIYNHDQEDDIFLCKKDPKVMKAIKEKLRLTERQRLLKIHEHKSYEEIKDKRVKNIEKSEEDNEES